MAYESENKDRRTSFEDMGRRMDSEIDKLISYINDEVVPSVRTHSSKGLRMAAQKLADFADYMDQQRTPAQTRRDSDEDIGS